MINMSKVLQMKEIKKLLKKKITIMFVPHEYNSVKKVKLPFIALITVVFISIFLICLSVYIISLGVDYESVKVQNRILTKKIPELKSFANRLKKLESALYKKLGVNNKREILENDEKLIEDGAKNDLNSSLEKIKYDFKFIENEAHQIQKFLNEKIAIYNSIPRGSPTENKEISSSFGKRIIDNLGGDYSRFHKGVDISGEKGDYVYATASGIVTFADWKGGYGKLIIIKHANYFSTFYAHNSKIRVKVGDKVKRGSLIGVVGCTGYATAPHVHYEVRLNGNPINPYKLVNDFEDEVMKYVF